MGFEIERKFLVTGEFRHLTDCSTEIIQGYMVNDELKTIRIRIAGSSGYLTIKGRPLPGKFGRGEWEYKVPAEDAKELLTLCRLGIIRKTRYYIPAGKHKYEVDVFHDKLEGLIIAEIELGSEEEVFEKPEWLGSEVTGNPEYYSSSLARKTIS